MKSKKAFGWLMIIFTLFVMGLKIGENIINERYIFYCINLASYLTLTLICIAGIVSLTSKHGEYIQYFMLLLSSISCIVVGCEIYITMMFMTMAVLYSIVNELNINYSYLTLTLIMLLDLNKIAMHDDITLNYLADHFLVFAFCYMILFLCGDYNERYKNKDD